MGLLSEETEALHTELTKRAEAASSSYSAAVDFLQYIYLVLVAKYHWKVLSIINNINHGYRAVY